MLTDSDVCGMNIQPIAYFRSPLKSKFGIPRQSGIVESLVGEIVLESEYANTEALRGLEDFDYLWIIWGFSENSGAKFHPTVRPPRLGGNRHMGVFATRSSFRPNGLALSSVRIVSVEPGKICVSGADLMDGTPIYDIKPYVEFVDSHPGARSGFVDTDSWQTLDVVFADNIGERLSPEERNTITALLAQDPRPQYHDDPERIYGMTYADMDIRFRVSGNTLTVVEIILP